MQLYTLIIFTPSHHDMKRWITRITQFYTLLLLTRFLFLFTPTHRLDFSTRIGKKDYQKQQLIIAKHAGGCGQKMQQAWWKGWGSTWTGSIYQYERCYFQHAEGARQGWLNFSMLLTSELQYQACGMKTPSSKVASSNKTQPKILKPNVSILVVDHTILFC